MTGKPHLFETYVLQNFNSKQGGSRFFSHKKSTSKIVDPTPNGCGVSFLFHFLLLFTSRFLPPPLPFLSTPPSQAQFLPSPSSCRSSLVVLFPPLPGIFPLLFHFFPLFSPLSAPFCLTLHSSSLPVSVFPFPVCAPFSSGSQSSSLQFIAFFSHRYLPLNCLQ